MNSDKKHIENLLNDRILDQEVSNLGILPDIDDNDLRS
jgi:hypothetical protein